VGPRRIRLGGPDRTVAECRPHYLKRGGLERRLRPGRIHQPSADRELIEELGRFARGDAFDEQPLPGVDSEALDFRVASESFALCASFGRSRPPQRALPR
jgi:ATP-dependent DNA helicase RecG